MRRWEDTAEKVAEAYGPLAIGVATSVATVVLGPRFFKIAAHERWHVDQLYAGPFALSIMITGLLAAFYALVLTSDRGFLKAARQTIYFKTSTKYCRRAIGLGITMAVCTLLLLLVQPAPQSRDTSLLAVSAWSGLANWSFAAAGRVTVLFALFAQPHGR